MSDSDGSPSFDGGHGSSSGHDHDSYGHAFHGGAFAGSSCGGSDSGFAYGFLSHAMAFMGVTAGSEDGGKMRGLRRVRLPGLALAERNAQVLVWPHGACDAESIAHSVMLRHGFRDIAFKKRDCAPYTKVENELRDTTPFDGHMFNSPMPSGWNPGATGFTRSFRCFWQIPIRKYWWSSLAVDVTEPVHIVLSGATWFFNEMGDFETRIALNISSRPLLECGAWRHREDLIKKHMQASRGAVSDIFDSIRRFEPSGSSKVQRQVQMEADIRAAELQRALETPQPGSEELKPDPKPKPVWPRASAVKPLDANQPDPMQIDEDQRKS